MISPAIGCSAAEVFRRAEVVAALYTVALPRSLADRLGMGRVRPVLDESIALALDVSPAWETKLAAMRCHATQLSSSPMMCVAVEKQRVFFGVENSVRAAVRRPDRDFLEEIFKTRRTRYEQRH
jgi:LmbE family N-acetylglucosaminyl deacetylase